MTMGERLEPRECRTPHLERLATGPGQRPLGRACRPSRPADARLRTSGLLNKLAVLSHTVYFHLWWLPRETKTEG